MTTATATLTKTDIQAMKTADNVSFHLIGGDSSICCAKDVANPGPFGDREKRYEITCETDVYDYSKPSAKAGDFRCFGMLHGTSHHDIWQTVVSLLKVGDSLTLRWVGANNNQNLEKAGLTKDELHLIVRREGKRQMVFPIDDSITPTHCTARMVKSA